jgi:hypothetical protein
VDNQDKGKVKKKSDSYLKYSGIAFQLAGLMIIGIFLGKKLDAWLGLEKPFMTMLLIMIFFSGYMYKLYVDLTKNEI